MADEPTNEPVPVNERVPRGPGGKNFKFLAGLMIVSIGMFGFAFANAEFFVMLCQEAGLLAKDPTKLRANIDEGEPGRKLQVYFSGHAEQQLPIAIEVDNSYQPTNVNKREVNDYFIRNLTDRTLYIRPIHDVNPIKALDYLELEECFCFTEQMLEPGQRKSFPVVYRFREDLPNHIKSIKMNYTLFPSTREAYEASLEEEENLVDAAAKKAAAKTEVVQ